MMKWVLFLKHFFLIFLVAIGCVSCARTPPVKQYFFNPIQQHKADLKPKTSQVLLVSLPIASTAFQSKDMLYVQAPYQLTPFSRHVWAASPTDMIAPLLVRRLQDTGYFYAVVSPPYVGLSDLRLETQLIALYQMFEKKRSYVVLTMQAELMDVGQGRVLKSKTFSVEVEASEPTPIGGVFATNQAVRQILDQVAHFAVTTAQKYSIFLFRQLPKPNLGS